MYHDYSRRHSEKWSFVSWHVGVVGFARERSDSKVENVDSSTIVRRLQNGIFNE